VHQNAKPVFVDIDKTTYNIDPDKIEKAITKKTRAIMPIHYGGQCSEMEEISEIASKHNLFVIEDAAPAIGATHKQRKAGTFGIISAFSFFPDKNLTTGEGGMVVTSDPELADKCEELRKNGASSRYYHTSIGWNFKMPDPNAALGLSQLKRIESIIATKNKIAKYYQVSLEKINEIQPPIVKEYNRHTFMLYSILTKDLKQREEIKNALADKGIESRINFPSVHLQPIYKQMFGFQSGSFPISENLSDRILGLPIFFSMKEEQQDQIVNVIREIVK
jgi:dTDP-4-amino-4,6-dideoxygalactose transaminase